MNRHWMLLLTALLPACDMATRVASVDRQQSTTRLEATTPSPAPIKIDPALRDALLRAETPENYFPPFHLYRAKASKFLYR